MMGLSTGLLVLALAAPGTTGDAKPRPAEAQPLRNLPDGWTYLSRQGVDTWPGAYHDKVSGAFVEFDLGAGIFTGWLSDDAAKKQGAHAEDGQLGDIRFRRYLLRGQRCGASAPAAGRGRLVVNFYTSSKPWNLWSFSASLCDELQAKRVEELLFNANRLWLGSLDEARTDRVRNLSDRNVAETKLGMEWEQIRDRLGPPSESERSGQDGFKVQYWVGGPETKPVWLVFDRNQRLVSK